MTNSNQSLGDRCRAFNRLIMRELSVGALPELMALPGGSAVWLVDYWMYMGGVTATPFSVFGADGSKIRSPGRKRSVALECAKHTRRLLRRIVDRSSLERIRTTRPTPILVAVFTTNYVAQTVDGESFTGDLHYGPIYRNCERNGWPITYLERDTTRSFRLTHPNRPSNYMDDIAMESLANQRELSVTLKQLNLKLEEYISNLGSMENEAWFRSVLLDWKRFRLRESLTLYFGARAFLRKQKPRVLVLIDEADMFGRALCMAGKAENIPVIALQHGILYDGHYGYTHIPESTQSLHGIPLADATVVWGKGYARTLMASGSYPPDSVVVTGCPRFDSVFGSQTDSNAAKKHVIVATQTHFSAAETGELLNAGKFVAQQLGLELVVRPHPAIQDNSNVITFLQQMGSPGRMVTSGRIEDLFPEAAVLITGYSTSIIDAAAYGVDAVLFAIPSMRDVLGYVSTGAVITIRSADEVRQVFPLSPALRERMQDGKNELLDRYLLHTRHATDSVVSLIESYCR